MHQQQETTTPPRFVRVAGNPRSRVANGGDFDGDAWHDDLMRRRCWVAVDADPNVNPEAILIITPICKHCGSDEILLDGNARWDSHLQDWYLDGTHDAAYCCQCCDDCRIVEVATPAGPSSVEPHSRSLTRAEVMAIFERTGDTLTFSDVTQALAAKRDAYDLAAVQAARKGSREGDLAVDENAITSRSEDSEGCYVMAWAWVPAPDQD